MQRLANTRAAITRDLQRAREKYPNARPRIISDNGPQFIAKEFKEFIRICAIGYVTPKDKLEGREQKIFQERDRKLQEARDQRKARRQQAAQGFHS